MQLDNNSEPHAGVNRAAIWRTAKDKRVEGYVSYLELQDWRAQNRGFEAIAGYKPNGFILLNEEQAEHLQGIRVTANFLSLLKVKPLRGRDFQVEEEKRGAEGVVIISHQLWQNRLGGSDAALGRQLDLKGKPFICTNVTNLMLARASARRKELALRVALGVGTWRIARHLLTESLLLALLSGGAGLLMAVWGMSAIKYYGAGQLPRLDWEMASSHRTLSNLVTNWNLCFSILRTPRS